MENPAAKLTLSLLRHGKSSWDDPDLDDHARSLNARGRAAADAMGAFMATRKLIPDLVLCSDAARTRATLQRVMMHFAKTPPKVSTESGLYLASATTMLARVRETAPDVRHVMMVGHNPGMHALALDLVGSGARRDIATLAMKFPTCGLAVLTFDVDTWMKIRPASGRLVSFTVPRQLD